MTITTLYAWAVPAFVSDSPVDHTWVTTYDSRINAYPNLQAVQAAHECYWYCWGSFHAQGGTPINPTGFLGSQTGDLAQAQCLVLPNADSKNFSAARGTIFTYGVDGVCHQLANQVLYATGHNGVNPLTVAKARGYKASIFLYGTYGLQHTAWQNKQNACGGSAATLSMSPGGLSMSSPTDEFEQHLKQVLGAQNEALANQVLALRQATHEQRASALALEAENPPTAEELNRRNQEILDQAAVLLGKELFEKVFGFPPEQKITLVDPEIARQANPK